jgi:YVTN family beta-propeller protein
MKNLLLSFFVLLAGFAQAQEFYFEAPALKNPTIKTEHGISIIPNGRLLTPRGKLIETAPHPYGLTLSKDGKTAVTVNSGVRPFSISIITDLESPNPKTLQVPEGSTSDEGILEACFMGVAISNDNNTIYVAGGETNKIFLHNAKTGEPKGEIDCSLTIGGIDYTHGYLGDMVTTADGKTLYVVDQIGFRIVEIDLTQNKVVSNIPSGRYPFGITLTPDNSKLIVANVGIFEYTRFTDLDPENLKETAHKYPSSKYGSKEMIEGDAKNGVLPLGDPNSPEGFSVWVINRKNREVENKIKTGFLVGQMIEDFPAVGGSSPNSVVATNDKVFVSNGNNDCISVINLKSGEVSKNIDLNPEPSLDGFRGIIPFGVTLSPDAKRLYVAESGINAVAVINTENEQVIGHIPTAWFPSKLAVSPDGKQLLVANAKGLGSGPNGGSTFQLGKEGSYIGALMKGYVSSMDIPTDIELKELTKRVVENNFSKKTFNANELPNPIPRKPLVASEEIKYIVFISKENRTYDEVFGQLETGDGEAEMARFGVNRSINNKAKTAPLDKVQVMPNHLALAKRFAISDNFFCDSDVSADGHRWIVGTYPNEWVETNTAASYGGKRGQKENSKAPGNLAIYGSAGSIYPEDYNEAGSIWEHFQRNNIDFFNFGFGVEMAGAYSDSTMKYIGELYTVNYPLPEPLFDKSSTIFPTYNMAIPDQFRADVFMKEFKEKWTDNNLPSVITLMLPNDHGTRERVDAGYPYQESYMADNDLALGRTIEFLSRTPYWKNMAVFVTEDDPQGGVDHVDAHRSLLMMASPYAKKNYNGHYHYSFGSIFKTFWHILGIPYLNQYDATATDMRDLFTDKPDFTPYNAVAPDLRIFDPQKALTPFDENFDWKAFSESEELDKTETMQKRREEDDKEKRGKN